VEKRLKNREVGKSQQIMEVGSPILGRWGKRPKNYGGGKKSEKFREVAKKTKKIREDRSLDPL
jgi:hypothetical protein